MQKGLIKISKPDAERILKYVSGLLFFYGVLEFKTLHQLVSEKLGEMDEEVLREVLCGEDYSESQYPFGIEDDVFFHLEVLNPQSVLDEQKKRGEIPHRPVEEKEARIISSGDFSVLWEKPENEFAKYLQEKTNLSFEEVREFIFQVQFMHKQDYSTMEIAQNILSDITLTSQDEIQGVLDGVIKVTNNNPLWILKGWSPNQVYDRFEKKELNPLPDESFSSTEEKKSPKVGRNEPCPCGSGKKFKKCCGNLALEEKKKDPLTQQEEGFAEENPTMEQWEALYEIAREFKLEKPWGWVADHEIFGIKDPETGKTAYCSIMGYSKQRFGIIAYPGSEGLDTILGILNDSINENTPETFLEQNFLMATFEDRDELDSRERKLIKDLGFKFRGRKEWPQFSSIRPGFAPWYLTAEECRFLTLILEQALEVSRFIAKKRPRIEKEWERSKVLVRVPRKEGQNLTWENQFISPKPPEKEFLSPKINNEVKVRKILSSCPQINESWEVDIFRLPAPIQENKDERPFFPLVLVILEAQEGEVLTQEMIAILEKEWETLVDTFLGLIEKIEARPALISVENKRTYFFFEGICEQLQIKIKMVRNHRFIPMLKEEMIQRMEMGG